MTFRILHRLHPEVAQTEEYRIPSSLTCFSAALFPKIKRHPKNNALFITRDFLRNKPHKNNFLKKFYETESSRFNNISIADIYLNQPRNFLHHTDYSRNTIYGSIRFLFSQPKIPSKQILRKKCFVILS
jgi:hypothetical protein